MVRELQVRQQRRRNKRKGDSGVMREGGNKCNKRDMMREAAGDERGGNEVRKATSVTREAARQGNERKGGRHDERDDRCDELQRER